MNRNIELESKPDFDEAMDRIEAWFHRSIIDRPPVRFTRHNAEFEAVDGVWRQGWHSLKDKWFDEEYQLEKFMTQVRGKRYLGETFPVYWPNLGPSVFSAFYGAPLEFGEVTSWAGPILKDYSRVPELDWENEHLQKLERLTRCALELAPGKFLVGYTDLHPGLDWLASLRGTESLLFDLVDNALAPLPLLEQVTHDFFRVFDRFHEMLAAAGQPSVTWMGIPAWGRNHIPSCDFACMISPAQFRTFALPALQAEAEYMDYNIFHVDGKGVARHLDAILNLPKLNAVQWVQGVGDDLPIMQWAPLIKRIQGAGKSVVVDLTHSELDDFIGALRPEGILLTMASEDEEEERAILDRVAKW